jgi:hypothetical protein
MLHNIEIRFFHSFFLSPGFVLNIAYDHCRILHTIPIFLHRKQIRRRYLASAPTANNVKRWSNEQRDNPPPPHGGDGITTGSMWHGLGVDKVLLFLDATRYVRDIGKLPEARKSFQQLERAINPSAQQPAQVL